MMSMNSKRTFIDQFTVIATSAGNFDTLSDIIHSDIIWTLEALAPVSMFTEIFSDQNASANFKECRNFLILNFISISTLNTVRCKQMSS